MHKNIGILILTGVICFCCTLLPSSGACQSLNSSQAESYRESARQMLSTKDWDGARKEANRAVKADPRNPWGWYYLAVAEYGLGNHKKARKAQLKCRELGPDEDLNPAVEALNAKLEKAESEERLAEMRRVKWSDGFEKFEGVMGDGMMGSGLRIGWSPLYSPKILKDFNSLVKERGGSEISPTTLNLGIDVWDFLGFGYRWTDGKTGSGTSIEIEDIYVTFSFPLSGKSPFFVYFNGGSGQATAKIGGKTYENDFEERFYTFTPGLRLRWYNLKIPFPFNIAIDADLGYVTTLFGKGGPLRDTQTIWLSNGDSYNAPLKNSRGKSIMADPTGLQANLGIKIFF